MASQMEIRRRHRVRRFGAMLGAVVLAAGCSRPAAPAGGLAHVRIAIGGQNQLLYLPTTLARELGFYREEGIDAELQDFAGGSKALEALVGGSADVVSGFYDHTIQMAAEGREMVAFVAMLRYPGLVLTTSPQRADEVSSIDKLKGHIVGVTAAGSSTQMILTYLLSKHGVDPASVSVAAIGAAATAVAAVEHGKVDAAMMAEPAYTIMRKRNPGTRVLADLRGAAGVKTAFDTDSYLASVIYSKGDWIRSHHDNAAHVARAIARTLQWMQTHTPAEITAKTPPTFRGGDDALYTDALTNAMAMFSPDGTIPAEGAEAVRRLLAVSMPKVRNANIDVSKTFTNEFLH
jgi:NitT/TauT family transport system substrate-binding protein